MSDGNEKGIRILWLVSTIEYEYPQNLRGGCKNFCVNGHLAGNCRYLVKSCSSPLKEF